MELARAQTSGSELQGRTSGGDGGTDAGGINVEAPNVEATPLSPRRIKSAPASTSAAKRWQKANRQVQVVGVAHKEVLSVKGQYRSGPAFYRIVLSNFRRAAVTQPDLYLQASFEVFLFMIACTWICTCIWNPNILLASKGGNRINDIFAYNNVCVGFDTPPARYVAQPLFALQSFLGVRFGNLDLLRLHLEWHAGRIDKPFFYFNATMDILFMGTMLLWPMLLIITPDAGGFGLNYHFYVYVIFVVIMYLTILAQFGTAPKEGMFLISKIWVGVHGGWTLLLLLIGFVGFNGYDYKRCPSDEVKLFYANGTHAEYCQQDPAIPVAIMSVLDYGWFILLLPASYMMPHSPQLNVPTALVIDENAKPVGRLAQAEERARIAQERGQVIAANAREQAKIAQEKAKGKGKEYAEIAKVKGKEAAVKAGAKAEEVKKKVQMKADDYKEARGSPGGTSPGGQSSAV